MNRSRCRVEVDTCGPRNRRLRCALSLPLLQQHVVVILSCVHWRALRWTLLLRRPLSIVIAIEGAVLCSLCVLMHVQWTHLNCRRTPSARMTTHGRLIEHDQCRRSWLCEHVTRRVVFCRGPTPAVMLPTHVGGSRYCDNGHHRSRACVR